jgi:hypothetical protein
MEKLHVGLAVASIVAVLLIFAVFLIISGRSVFIA